MRTPSLTSKFSEWFKPFNIEVDGAPHPSTSTDRA